MIDDSDPFLSKSLLTQLKSVDTEVQLAIITALLNSLKTGLKPLRINFITDDIVSQLIYLLGHADIETRHKILEIFDIILKENCEMKQMFLNKGILKRLSKFLSSSDIKTTQQVAKLVANFTVDSGEHVQAIFDADLVTSLIDLLYERSYKAEKEAAKALFNITKNGTEKQILSLVDINLIPPFCNLFNNIDDKTDIAVLKTFTKILKIANNRRKEICNKIEDYGGLRTIKLLRSSQNKNIASLSNQFVNEFF